MGWWWLSSSQSDPKSSTTASNHQPASPTSSISLPRTEPSIHSADTEDPDENPYLPIEKSKRTTEQVDSALYPTTLSCRSTFDSAYYCASLGGKFNDIYRFGELQSCSEHWAAWRFCMGLKVLPDEERKRKVREFYREKEARVKVGKNSEDVWKVRSEPVRRFMWKSIDEEDTAQELREEHTS